MHCVRTYQCHHKSLNVPRSRRNRLELAGLTSCLLIVFRVPLILSSSPVVILSLLCAMVLLLSDAMVDDPIMLSFIREIGSIFAKSRQTQWLIDVSDRLK